MELRNNRAEAYSRRVRRMRRQRRLAALQRFCLASAIALCLCLALVVTAC